MFDLPSFNRRHGHQAFEQSKTMPALDSAKDMLNFYEEIEFFASNFGAAIKTKTLLNSNENADPNSYIPNIMRPEDYFK